MSPREVRYAKNQELFRQVNDRIATLTGNWWAGQRLVIICECANTGCAEQVDVPLAEYRRVRERPDWLLIKPGHVAPDVEEVIEQHDGYDVIKV